MKPNYRTTYRGIVPATASAIAPVCLQDPRPLRRTLVAIALELGLLAMPAAASAAPLTFGIHTPGDPFAGNTNGIDELERDLGRRVGIVSWFRTGAGSRG